MSEKNAEHVETLRAMFAVCANERRMMEADALNAAIAALLPSAADEPKWTWEPITTEAEHAAAFAAGKRVEFTVWAKDTLDMPVSDDIANSGGWIKCAVGSQYDEGNGRNGMKYRAGTRSSRPASARPSAGAGELRGWWQAVEDDKSAQGEAFADHHTVILYVGVSVSATLTAGAIRAALSAPVAPAAEGMTEAQAWKAAVDEVSRTPLGQVAAKYGTGDLFQAVKGRAAELLAAAQHPTGHQPPPDDIGPYPAAQPGAK